MLLDVQDSEIEVEHDVQLDDEVEVELVQHDVMQHVEVTTMVEIDDVDASLIFHEYLLYMHDDEDDEVVQVEVQLNDDDVVDVIELPDALLLHIEVDEVVDIHIVEKDHDVMRQCVDDDENDDEHNILLLIQGDVDDEVY